MIVIVSETASLIFLFFLDHTPSQPSDHFTPLLSSCRRQPSVLGAVLRRAPPSRVKMFGRLPHEGKLQEANDEINDEEVKGIGIQTILKGKRNEDTRWLCEILRIKRGKTDSKKLLTLQTGNKIACIEQSYHTLVLCRLVTVISSSEVTAYY